MSLGVRLGLVAFSTMVALEATAATNYQDWWWEPAKSGMGVSIGQQENTLFVAWYHFSDDGKATYLTFSGNLTGNAVEGILARSTGPAPGPSYNRAEVKSSTVGNARISFAGDNAATLSYTYDGRSGVLNLQRFTFQNVTVAGSWRYAGVGNVTNCRNASYNGSFETDGYATLTAGSGGNYVMAMLDDDGDYCTYTIKLPQNGSLFSGSGTFSCSSGVTGSVTVDKLRRVDDFLTVEYSAQVTVGESCRETGRFGAVIAR